MWMGTYPISLTEGGVRYDRGSLCFMDKYQARRVAQQACHFSTNGSVMPNTCVLQEATGSDRKHLGVCRW